MQFTAMIRGSISQEQIQTVFNQAKYAVEGMEMTLLGLKLRSNPFQTLEEIYLETASGGQITYKMLMDAYEVATVKPDQAASPFVDEFTGLEVSKMVKTPKMGGSATKSGPITQASVDMSADIAARLKKFVKEEGDRQQAALDQALMAVTLDPYTAREV